MTATTRLAPPASFADTRPAAPGAMSDLGRQARTFILVGVVSTLAYAGLFTLLRAFETAEAANVVALVVTAIGNTAANRRLTFGVRGRASFVRDQLAGLLALAVALAITSGAIALLGRIAPGCGPVGRARRAHRRQRGRDPRAVPPPPRVGPPRPARPSLRHGLERSQS